MALITHEDKPDNVEDEVTDKVTRTVEGVKISGKEKTGSEKKHCFGISMTKPTQKWVVEV